MKTSNRIVIYGALATLAAAALSPAALADSRQKNKNDWRNLAGVGAAVAGYGLLKGNKTATVLGAAGAAYSANRYEKDRHSQSQQNNDRRYFYRSNSNYGTYGTPLSGGTTRRYYRSQRSLQRSGPPYGHAYGYHRKRGY